MEETRDDFFNAARKELEQYVQDRILLLKLQTSEKTARLIALMFSVLMIALLTFFVLLFISIMGGYFFAGITGSLYTGFGIVASFYLLLLFVVIRYRNRFEKKIIDTVISIFFDKNDEDDEKSR